MNWLQRNAIYAGRLILMHGTSSRDYKKFPFRMIRAASNPYNFHENRDLSNKFEDIENSIPYLYKNNIVKADLNSLLEKSGTTAFIVLKDNSIICERYYNNYSRESWIRSFSISKSFITALVGIMIEKEIIHSLDVPFTDYLPEFKDRGLDEVTLKQLLLMSSGVRFTKKSYPWNDMPKTYFFPDLRYLTFKELTRVETPGSVFRYNNYNPALIGMILEKLTGVTISKLTEDLIWKPMGARYSATWSMDSHGGGFELIGSGLNARAIDLCKYCCMYLNDGYWNENQILTQDWVKESTVPEPVDYESYYGKWMKKQRMYYKYFWWGHLLDNNDYNYFASGHLGQTLYVSPRKKLVIARFGERKGRIDFGWQQICKILAERF